MKNHGESNNFIYPTTKFWVGLFVTIFLIVGTIFVVALIFYWIPTPNGEAFTISNQTTNGFWVNLFTIVFGLAWIVAGGTFRLFRTVHRFFFLLMILLGIGILSYGMFSYYKERNQLESFVRQVNDSNVLSIEGTVKVEFEAPFSGHMGGDIIYVADKRFVIEQGSGRYYYHNSIAYGGILRQNAHVRIQYIPTNACLSRQFGDGQIVRIEMLAEEK